jgi:predicted NAD-dependent protein-ADP-ribosyltransferase YbiA (DUF1768 family)
MKTTNAKVRLAISVIKEPGKAKAEGRKLKMRSDWDTGRNLRLDAMRLVVKKKFKDPTLARKLLATGDRLLYETNTWNDNYWGRVFNTKTGKFIGENHLGRILMAQRDELRRKQKKD